MKKSLLLGFVLASFLASSQEKVNKSELQKIAIETQLKYDEAKLFEEAFLKQTHPFPEMVSYEGKNSQGVPEYLAEDSRSQILSMNTDFLADGSIPSVNATGAGMTAFMWDGGQIRGTHQEYAGRITNINSGSISQHSTGVAGVIISSGVNPNAKGIAYEAVIKGYDYSNNLTEMNIASQMSDNANYMISNHSYGSLVGWYYNNSQSSWYWYGYPHISETESPLFGLYTSTDASWDNIAFNAPQHSMFKSAGNNRGEGPGGTVNHYAYDATGNWYLVTGTLRPRDCSITGGYDCISFAGSVSKNIILVGAINPFTGDPRYQDPSNVVATSFTSFGPTDDGRIKPDVCAIGQSVVAPLGATDSDYSNWSGTSFSSPAAAGVGLLLEEVQSEADGTYLRSDMMKALLTHTANEAGTSPGPDYKFGYGLIDAFRAVETMLNVNNDSFTANLAINDGGTYTVSMVALGDQPLKASIAWLDPAGTPLADLVLNDRTPMLVNDLDLRVSNGTTTYYPWKLNPEAPSDAATQEDNFVDNTEQVWIENPVAGQTYTVTVNHKGTLTNGAQNFALVITGANSFMGTSDVNLNDVLAFYPNPVVNSLNIKASQTLNNASIKVFNQMGQIVYNQNFNQIKSNQSFDFSTFPAGVYMVYLKSDEGTITKKIIKK